MEQNTEGKMLTEAEYERLCREACSSLKASASDAVDEDAYWLNICQKVYCYFDMDFMYDPIENVTRGEVYRRNLLEFVRRCQSGSFNPLAIANKYIKEALGKTRS